MAREIEDITRIIKSFEAVPQYVIEARENNKTLLALIEGDDFTSLLVNKIEHIESDTKAESRRKYSRNVEDSFVRLLRLVDNVYNATGSSKEYSIKDGKIKDNILSQIANIRGGKSLEQWLETTWMNVYHTDPSGLIFLEWKDTKTWPTYKSIGSIRAYSPNGQNVDWVLFEPSIVKIEGTTKSTKTVWRFVDEDNDYEIIQNGDSFVINEDNTFINPFEECPAIINSDLVKVNTGLRLSPVQSIVALMKEYARDQSIKTLYKFLHGFPLFWKLVQNCDTCHGSGKVDGGECKACDGHGFYMKKDITDAITINAPESKEDASVVPDIAGYIVPPLDIWDQYTKELQILEDLAAKTHWGTQLVSGENETATGRFIDVQPIEGRLDKYANVAEFMETQISEWVIKINDSSVKPEDDHAHISYGRGYIIEPIAVLLEKYETAREKGVNITILDRLFNEYLTAKYKTDPVTLLRNQVKAEVEPYLHYTAEQVMVIFGQIEAQKKLLFRDWWETLLPSNKTTEQLKKDFDAWSKARVIVNTDEDDDSM